MFLKGTLGGFELREWLKNIRNDKGLTQEDVANACSIARSYYTHIENGVKTPSVPVAKKIGNILQFEWTVFFAYQCSLEEQMDGLSKKIKKLA